MRKTGSLCHGLLTGTEVQKITGDIFTEYTIGKECFRLDEVNLLPPCMPTKIVAVGLNYRGHAQEMNMAIPDEPLLFLKPATAVIGPGAPIIYPKMSQRVDYEGELGVVIGRRCRNVSEQQCAGLCFRLYLPE